MKQKILTALAFLSLGIGAFLAFNKPDQNSKVATPSCKPPLPVEVGYYFESTDERSVCQLKNTSNTRLGIDVILSNPELRTSKMLNVELGPHEIKEIGHLEGWDFASGDIISLNHVSYLTWSGRYPSAVWPATPLPSPQP